MTKVMSSNEHTILLWQLVSSGVGKYTTWWACRLIIPFRLLWLLKHLRCWLTLYSVTDLVQCVTSNPRTTLTPFKWNFYNLLHLCNWSLFHFRELLSQKIMINMLDQRLEKILNSLFIRTKKPTSQVSKDNYQISIYTLINILYADSLKAVKIL